MIILSIVVAVALVGLGSTIMVDGMKVKTDEPNLSSTVYHNSDGDLNGITFDSIDEAIFKDINLMSVKMSIKAKSGTHELPIQLYSEAYKIMKTKLGQRQTRIAAVTMLWTPTTDDCKCNAILSVYDERYPSEGIQSHGLFNSFFKGKKGKIKGSPLTLVTFNPALQQFIYGSLNIATATSDINKLKFYLTVDSDMTGIIGFLDVSWKTTPDVIGVYEKKKWDVFTFPVKPTPELSEISGRTQFDVIKNYLRGKYDSQKEKLREIENLHLAAAYGDNQGVAELRKAVNERITDVSKLMSNTENRLAAIKLKSIKVRLNELEDKYKRALMTGNPDTIRSIQVETRDFFNQNGIPLDNDEIVNESKGDLENKPKNAASKTGLVTIKNKDLSDDAQSSTSMF